MTVKELQTICENIENKDMQIVTSSYAEEINGYYFKKQDDKEVLVLTSLNVQPRK